MKRHISKQPQHRLGHFMRFQSLVSQTSHYLWDRRNTIVPGLALLILGAVEVLSLPVRNRVFGYEDSYLQLIAAENIEAGNWSYNEAWKTPNLIPIVIGVTAHLFDGDVSASTRSVALLVHLLGGLGLFLLMQKLGGRWPAIGATALFFLSPMTSFFATEPEKAAFVVNLFLLGCGIFVVAKGVAVRAIGCFVVGLSFASHYSAFFLLPAFLMLVLGHFMSSLSEYRKGTALGIHTGYVATAAVPFLAFHIGHTMFYEGETFVSIYANTAQSNIFSGLTTVEGFHFYPKVAAFIYPLSISLAVLGIVGVMGRRNFRLGPLFFGSWLFFVLVGFGLQYPAASHASRYPLYAVPAALAGYCLIPRVFRFRLDPKTRRLAEVSATALLVIPLAAAFASEQHPNVTSDLYQARIRMGDFVADQNLLENHTIMYNGWPSLVWRSIDGDTARLDHFIDIGIEYHPERLVEALAKSTPDYFIYDRVTAFNNVYSGHLYREDLIAMGFDLEQVHSESRGTQTTVLYRVLPPS